MTADILLATFNAKYIHSAFGLRCLAAQLGALRRRAVLLEFDGRTPVAAAAERILAAGPRIVGLSVSIWNLDRTRELAAALRGARPGVLLVAGGPEVSCELEGDPLGGLVDCVVQGEGDLVFAELCRAWLARGERPPAIVRAPPPDLAALASPYAEYTETDLRQRTVYVETTRGCAFACAYCTSAIAPDVRRFPESRVWSDLADLWNRGLRHFKFVDRTFNWDPAWAARVLDFFIERQVEGLRVHMEMRPDLFTDGLWESVSRFQAGALHFEVGVQTLDPEVARRIGRAQDAAAVLDATRRLAGCGVDVHADLIVGLPGETLEGFLDGLDRLSDTGAGAIQINLLKRLRGTPLAKRSAEWGLVFAAAAPYAVRQTPTLDAATLGRLAAMARFWGLIHYRGGFPRQVERLLALAGNGGMGRAREFLACSDALAARFGRTHSIPRHELAAALDEWLTAREQGSNYSSRVPRQKAGSGSS